MAILGKLLIINETAIVWVYEEGTFWAETVEYLDTSKVAKRLKKPQNSSQPSA